MRLLCSIISLLIVLVGAWCLGFNFDTRGPAAFTVFMYAVGAPIMIWFYPGWKEKP